MDPTSPRIAVLLPCHNEEVSIARTISNFRLALPGAEIFVCDNRSTDATAQVARQAGAVVLSEKRKGKGNAVRKLFSAVDADVYIMADGDDTYDSSASPRLVERLLSEKLDMIIGKRVEAGDGVIYRSGHRFGNQMFNRFLKFLFGSDFTDIFSGYRVMSKGFVKSFPIHSAGFDIETELAVHALSLGVSTEEIDTPYRARGEDSHSKLNKYRDGPKILFRMIKLFAEFRPLLFFGIFAFLFLIPGATLFLSVLREFLETGLVPRFPSLIVSMMLLTLSGFSVAFGVILKYVSKSRIETKKLFYLSHS